MLKRLRVQGFKSLADIEFEFPALTVLFGPNASGKSNLLDALLTLSRLAKNLKAEIDEDLIKTYRGSVSLPLPRASTSTSPSRLWTTGASRA
jgi:AAA15 family ATPase/GTPase